MSPGSERNVPSAATLLWWALASVVLVRLASLGLLPLSDTSEARYGDIGRRMLELGDGVTPWFDDGVPFWGKPPLSVWMTAGGMALFGFGEFGARVGHFAAAVFVAAVVWDWQRRDHGPLRARFAVSLLWASALFYLCAGAVLTDMALLVGLMLAMRGFWRALHAPAREARLEGWLFFVGLGVGLLAKGPIVLALVMPPVVAWVLVTRQVAWTWCTLPWLRGTAIMLAIAAPWYLLAERRTPGFLDYFLVGEHWRRFTIPGWDGDRYGTAHLEARGMIWAYLLQATLPWPLLLPLLAWGRPPQSAHPPAVPGTAARTPAALRRSAYLWAWALWPCVFFTASHNILWTYVLPGLPALAILGADWLSRDPRTCRSQCLVAAGLALTALVFVGALAKRSLDGEFKSARAVIAAFETRRTAADELVFVGDGQFSVAFYGRGRYRPLPDFVTLEDRLEREGAGTPGGGHLYVAIRRWSGERPSPALQVRLRHEGAYQGYVLMRLVR